MSQITVRGVDAETKRRLEEMAAERHESLNRVVLAAIREYAGSSPRVAKAKRYHDLDHLFGVWTREETEAFERELVRMRAVDKDMWQ